MKSIRYDLTNNDIPKFWYNIQSDLPQPLDPPLHPVTHQPIGPDDLAPLFPMSLILQEVSQEKEIEIPEPIRKIYAQWRPTPLFRARRLEQILDTPARIYYKYEGVSPAGSHKPNTAVAQAFYNKQEGINHLSTETGAGQWGSALSMACAFFDMKCSVFMVKISYDQKPYRRGLIETFGSQVFASPSSETEIGRSILAKTPGSPGSLGIAISEAVEMAATNDKIKYSLGSVLNHVLLHQTIIGLESLKQFELADDYPDIVIGCTGGGSNFGGFVFPFLGQKLRKESSVQILAVEPSACPTLTKGTYAYDFGDTGKLAPIVKMHTLGASFVPPPFHAGGLRYHGMSPLVSKVKDLKLIDAESFNQLQTFQAGLAFARAEGILPAPEANHAVASAIQQALKCKQEGTTKTIAFNLCGHGHFDMQAYLDFHAGKLKEYAYPEEDIQSALEDLPKI